MKKVFLIIVMALPLILPFSAIAALTPFDAAYQQITNRPCVIGDMSCGAQTPANWDYTAVPNGDPFQTGQYDLFSPVYQAWAGSGVVGQVGIDLIPTSFKLGVDMNFATGQTPPETIVFFQTLVSDTGTGNWVVDSDNSWVNSGSLTFNNDNGTGFSDFVLEQFSLTAGKYYQFEASLINATDGMEQYFFIPAGSTQVPEPATLLLLGLGLVGIAGIKRKFDK